MPIRDEPHYELPAAELAAWVERQPDQWWSVDGERVLAGRMPFPAPSDKLAAMLRLVGRPLLVKDRRPEPKGAGEVIDADMLDALATPLGNNLAMINGGKKPDWAADRLFDFCWKASGGEWLLVEDSGAANALRRIAGVGSGR